MAMKQHILARMNRSVMTDLVLTKAVNQICRQVGHEFRDRLLTPLVTIRLFILQVLNANTAITHLRHLSGVNFSPGSYCDARKRLPLQVLQDLMLKFKDWAGEVIARDSPPLLGQRVLVVDGSTASMPDTPDQLEKFGMPWGQKAGVGYPTAKIMGLLDVATGMFIQLLALNLFTHDLRGAIQLHGYLRASDILLGDRAFCSFAHFCLLNEKSVFGCFRLHQRRKNLKPGLQRWKKPPKAPAWMTAAQYALLPAEITVRVVRYSIEQNGFRTRTVFIATTLLDEKYWTAQRIAALYGNRWPIETSFNHLKTTLKMDQLKCKSNDGILKELTVYLIVYNLVRLVMLKMAKLAKVCVDRISFIDAARALSAWMIGLTPVVPLVVNPKRPARHNPRVIRRRLKPYDLMNKPRAEYRQTSENTAVAA